MEAHVLVSWKEIARHLGKSVRTVQRWELVFGMPVRRSERAPVSIHRKELERWLAERFTTTNEAPRHTNLVTLRSTLRRNIQLSRQLQASNLRLTAQLSQSTRLFSEQCRRLAAHSLERPTLQPPARR
jgi:hypothetical protein